MKQWLNIFCGIVFSVFLFFVLFLTEFILYFPILLLAFIVFYALYSLIKENPDTKSNLDNPSKNKTQYIAQNKEYVYILSNVSMPGLIKIGRTNRSVDARLKELNSTSLPTHFTVEHTIETRDSSLLEKMIHNNFDKHRVNENREFFKIDHKIVIEYANSINKVLN